MNISIENHSSYFRFTKKRKEIVRKVIEYLMAVEKKEGNRLFKNFVKKTSIKNIQINLLFVDDREMKEYNKKYFNTKSSTDVIAFSMIEGVNIKNNFILGDAIMSVETAKANGELYNHSLKEELLLLIIHGVLHLMGYNHSFKNSAMTKKQQEYFRYVKEILLNS